MSFTHDQRRVLPQVLERAECLTADRFRLSAFDARRFPYDLATLDPGAAPVNDVLARVVRLDRVSAPPPAKRSLYRIELQDPVIRRRLRASPGLAFEDLMLYVLTHELVHVVRFCTYRHCYGASEHVREELNVAAETATILRPLGRPSLVSLLETAVD